MLTYDRDELMALLRVSDRSRGTVLSLTRPYALPTVREVTRLMTKRAPASSASRADMAYAIAVSLRPKARARPSRSRRNTSPTACRDALYGPLRSTTD